MDRNNRRERETSEAARWWDVIFVPSNEPSSVEREEFIRWLRESPANVAELLHMAHVHDVLKRFKLWNELNFDVEPTKQTADVVPFADYREAKHSTSLESPPNKTWWRPVAFVAVACAAVMMGVLLAPGWFGESISTAHGERRVVTLNDGSVVQLDPETILNVRLGDRERHVTLKQGRAVFRVAKDPQRAFLVAANETVVRAVGTVFGVEESSNHNVVVTVAEGRVAVLPPPDLVASARREGSSETPSSATGNARPQMSPQTSPSAYGQNAATKDLASDGSIYLSAGKQLTIAISGVESVRAVNAQSELSWAEGRLVFNSTPLGEALEEFNRYNHVRLSVRDPVLASRPISGVFEASDPDTLIAFIKAGTDVSVTHEQQGAILIAPLSRDDGFN